MQSDVIEWSCDAGAVIDVRPKRDKVWCRCGGRDRRVVDDSSTGLN